LSTTPRPGDYHPRVIIRVEESSATIVVIRAISHKSPKCSKPKKYQDRNKNKGKATTDKKKNFKNRGRAYVGEWIFDDDEDEDDEQEEEEEASEDEEVTEITIKCGSPLPPPHMCFMAKGGAKKKKQDPRKGTWGEATDSDS